MDNFLDNIILVKDLTQPKNTFCGKRCGLTVAKVQLAVVL